MSEYHNGEKPISKRFIGRSRLALRFFRYFMLCLLVLILAIIIIVNRDSINMDNLRRMWAKIDISLSVRGDVDGQRTELEYDEDVSVASFKDGLAHLTPSHLTVMDNIGTVFMSTDTGFVSPQLLTDSRYVVAYDRGGNRLIVTNSFTVVFEKEMKEKIASVFLSENHYLCVITAGGGYKNSLYVYDASFEEIYVWHSNDRYLLSAAVSPDKKTVALTCYNTKGDNFAELVVIYLDREEIAWSSAIKDVPLSLCYKSSSHIALMYSDSIVFYNGKGEEGKSYTFEQNFLSSFYMDADHTVILLSTGKRGDATLYSINDRGAVLSKYDVGGAVDTMCVKEDRVAMLTAERTLIYSLTGKKVIYEQDSQEGVQTICFGGKNCLLDIYNTHCVYNEIN